MNRRRTIFVGGLLMLSVTVVGCWDYVDVERRSLVLGVAVDVDPEHPEWLKLSVEIPVPAGAEPGGNGGGGGGDRNPKLIASASGASLMQAGNLLRGRVEREPLWDQVAVIIVGEQVARDGIGRVADVVMRFNDLNMRAHLYVAEGNAEELLQHEPVVQPLTSQNLRSIADQFAWFPQFPRPEPFVLVHRRLREQRTSLIPKLSLEKDQIVMSGAGVLSDGVLIGWLDGTETEGANWIHGWTKRSLVQFECTGHPEGYIAAWARSDHHRIRTAAPDELPHFVIEVSLSARLVDMSRCPLVPEDKSDADKIATALMHSVTKTMEAAVDLAKNELQVDFLGLGEQWRRNFPALAKATEWKEVFPESTIEVKVNMSPTGIGFPGQLREAVPYR